VSTFWFRATDSNFRKPIEDVEVVSFTAHTVSLMDGRRAKRATSYESYFLTWEEARSHLISLVERRIDQLQLRIDMEKSHLGNLKGLKRD
jgi:hypothetical protein